MKPEDHAFQHLGAQCAGEWLCMSVCNCGKDKPTASMEVATNQLQSELALAMAFHFCAEVDV